MYGRDYSNNYSLTICWIKKNFKSWYLQQEILFFSNALQNEINDDNEKHLTLFVICLMQIFINFERKKILVSQRR